MPSRLSRRPLVRAILGLGLLATVSGCGVAARAIREQTTGMASPGPRDSGWAKAAWQYFRTARSGATGLVDTSAGGGFTTPSTIGDQIAASIAAYRLGVADKAEFDASISQILQFLSNAPLSGNALPGRYYSTATGRLVDPPATEADPGWSAVELGRLLVWLRVLTEEFPQYAPYVVQILDGWPTCSALDAEGRLQRALPSEGGFTVAADSGSGYEAYAAQGFRAWGATARGEPAASGEFSVAVEGVDLPIEPAPGESPPALTAPYALLGIEFGWSAPRGGTLEVEKRRGAQLFAVQDRRFARTGFPTARTDFRRSAAPYVLADSVLARGIPWSTVAPDGRAHPDLALLSTRAAFGLWALGAGGQGRRLIDAVGTLHDAGTGWFEGRYEASGGYEWTRTAATNAMVLEALLYRETGTLFPSSLSRLPTAESEGRGNAGDCRLPDLRARR